MSQPVPFVNALAAACQQLSQAMDQLGYLQERYNLDNTLVTNYFSQQGARTDIGLQDLLNVLNTAYVQLNIPYTTGSPTLQSLFDKLL